MFHLRSDVSWKKPVDQQKEPHGSVHTVTTQVIRVATATSQRDQSLGEYQLERQETTNVAIAKDDLDQPVDAEPEIEFASFCCEASYDEGTIVDAIGITSQAGGVFTVGQVACGIKIGIASPGECPHESKQPHSGPHATAECCRWQVAGFH